MSEKLNTAVALMGIDIGKNPTAEVAAAVAPTLSANAQHCASTLAFSQQVVHESRRDG